MEPEPGVQFDENLVNFARKSNYDLVIGIGGGSSLDIAKVASIAIKNSGAIANFIGVDRVYHDKEYRRYLSQRKLEPGLRLR